MTNTYNVGEMQAFHADPNFLFMHSKFVHNANRFGGHYVQTPIFKDSVHPIGIARRGAQVLIDGRMAIVTDGEKNVEVRFQDDGMPGRVFHTYPVTVVGLLTYEDWYPKIGEVVRVLKGEHAYRVGIVYSSGKLSTYVAFPGFNEKLKFNAKHLQIVKGHIVLD